MNSTSCNLQGSIAEVEMPLQRLNRHHPVAIDERSILEIVSGARHSLMAGCVTQKDSVHPAGSEQV